MILSFFESIKYLGHMWPVALLRIYAGYFFIQAGLEKIHLKFLSEPILQDTLYKWMSQGIENQAYLTVLQNVVMPHWQLFSYLVVFGEIAVGLSYVVGFLVRPAALGALFMNINFLLAGGVEAQALNQIFIIINLTLLLVSAGRVLGFDYYFFKKIRGLWW